MKRVFLLLFYVTAMFSVAQEPAQTIGFHRDGEPEVFVPEPEKPQDSPELAYFRYTILAEHQVKIVQYTGNDQEVEIPSTLIINGEMYTVIEIGEKAFSGKSSLKKITIPNTILSVGVDAFAQSNLVVDFKGSVGDWARINFSSWSSNPVAREDQFYLNDSLFDGKNLVIPDSIKKIGNYAFRAFSQIETLVISNGVECIGASAFLGCDNMVSIKISESVNNVQKMAFGRCNALKEIVVDSANQIYDSREKCNAIVDTKTNTLIVACNKSTIPNTIKKIGDYSFYDCDRLKSLILPTSIEGIGVNAFESCDSLVSIKLNEGLKYIHAKAFIYCYSLESIEMPNTVTSIGGGAFSGCTNLRSVKLSNALTSLPSAPSGYSNVISTGMFAHCKSLSELIIPDSVTSIGDWAFNGCSSLTSLIIPSSVIAVGSNTFNSLPALESVVICSAAKDMIFFQCPSLTHITWNVKSGVDSQKPFERIKNQVLSFTFGEDVEYIPANICNGMTNLESIVIPENIKRIGELAFANCNKLTNVTWNATNSEIGKAIFQNTASKIECFNFGESVSVIPDLLCDGMCSLTSMTIPKNVTRIGRNVFRFCRNITTVYWNAENCEPTWWGEYQSDWYKNKEINVRNDLYILDTGKQDWYMYGPFSNISDKITSFKIGNNVQQIPSCLCFGMSKARITFHQNIQSIGKYALSEVYKVQFQGKVTQCANVFYNNSKWYDTIIYVPQEYLKYYKKLRDTMGLKKSKVKYIVTE